MSLPITVAVSESLEKSFGVFILTPLPLGAVRKKFRIL
jgi:hypothetical protein